MSLIIKTLSLFVLYPTLFFAQTIIKVPEDYPTIQTAIESAEDFDSILVSSGVFHDNINIMKPITIIGSGLHETIIKSSTTFGLPLLIEAENVSLNNLRITNSHNQYGINIVNSKNCEINNCIVDSTRPPLTINNGEDGKGINIDFCDNVLIKNCIITNNTGGAAFTYGCQGFGIYINNSNNVNVHSTLISENKGSGPEVANGYGISINNSQSVIIDSSIIENHVQYNGDAGICIKSSSEVYLRNNRISENRTGIIVSDNATAQIGGAQQYSNEIINNEWSIRFLTYGNLDATWNYWGFFNSDSISKSIYDCNEHSSFGCVNFDNFIITSISQNYSQLPANFKLFYNYPNPFNPSTKISFYIGSHSTTVVSIKIYNLLGQLVNTIYVDVNGAGFYEAVWDGKFQNGTTASSGIYVYIVDFGNKIIASKMNLIK